MNQPIGSTTNFDISNQPLNPNPVLDEKSLGAAQNMKTTLKDVLVTIKLWLLARKK